MDKSTAERYSTEMRKQQQQGQEVKGHLNTRKIEIPRINYNSWSWGGLPWNTHLVRATLFLRYGSEEIED